MTTQRLVHVIPVEIQPAAQLKFSRVSLQEGVSLRRAVGPLARYVSKRAKSKSIRLSFTPTHLIVVDQSNYLISLDKRLAASGTSREKPTFEYVDISAIARQVLVAVTLLGRSVWKFGGCHTLDHSGPDFPYSSAGFSPQPMSEVGGPLRYHSTSNWFQEVRPQDLRLCCELLDRYYRHGSWWVDRLSVALGYFWSGLTCPHAELAFVAFCTSLEAIASTSQSEITHILAERCAVLVHPPGPERVEMYLQIKKIYDLRSKIVHGRSALRKGNINRETLAITAKRSQIPQSQVVKLLGITIQVIQSVLKSPKFLELLHVKRSEEELSKAVEQYFRNLLLREYA